MFCTRFEYGGEKLYIRMPRSYHYIFSSCAKGTRLLTEAGTNQLNLEKRGLKQYVETHWKTLRDMIESVVENLEVIKAVLFKID